MTVLSEPSDVDRFCRAVIRASTAELMQTNRLDAQARRLTRAAVDDRAAMWQQSAARIRAVLPEAKTLADLPAWVHEMAERLGVEPQVPGSLAEPQPQAPGTAVRGAPTHLTLTFPPEYYDSDAGWENEDWSRRRRWPLTTDKAEFLAFLKATRTSVAEFKRWPIYRWHKDKIPWLCDLRDDEA